MLKVYAYSNCGSCRKALKYLADLGIEFQLIPIREQAPELAEIKRMIAAYDGNIKRLFNTSGTTYREMGIKDRLPTLSEREAIDLMRSDGNLIKRPFVIGKDVALAGFKEPEWDHAFRSE